MRVRDLLAEWQKTTEGETRDQTLEINLTRRTLAKLAALSEMYPGSKEDIVTDLIEAALQELEAVMPYIPGPRVISEDEQGDPMYEDIGPLPRYRALTLKYLDKTGD